MNIVIADPQARVRHSLHVLLEQTPGWIVTGEAADCEDLLDLLPAARPDLVLIDWSLMGMPEENLMQLLRNRYATLRVIAMSGQQELSQAALKAGADAFVCKAESPEKLLNIISKIRD